MSTAAPIERQIVFDDINPLEVYGAKNEKLELMKTAYPGVKFIARGSTLKTLGDADKLALVGQLIESILAEIRRYGGIDKQRVRDLLASQGSEAGNRAVQHGDEHVILRGVDNKPVKPRTPGQLQIVQQVNERDVVFAVGPAGSGKTYTAVAMAVQYLKRRKVQKIILCRPAVEAGEQLGFLPGDLKDKVDPYLRPLYDALGDMIPGDRLEAYLEKNIIEIAPLAYMRGRTLNNAFILLDEAQNATQAQLKMFLTRMGIDSKIVVTGDATQIDLPKRHMSGLLHALQLFQGIDGIGWVTLSASDVVRHPLVRKILAAYEVDEAEKQAAREERQRSRHQEAPPASESEADSWA